MPIGLEGILKRRKVSRLEMASRRDQLKFLARQKLGQCLFTLVTDRAMFTENKRQAESVVNFHSAALFF